MFEYKKFMKSEILPPKVDVVFKMLFGDKRNERIAASFLKSILKLDDSELAEIEIVDPTLKSEYQSDKYSIVDVNIKTSTGKIIHIEMQVADQKEMRDRATYYNTKLVSTQLNSGQDYDELRKTISVIIADFDMIPEIQDRCHNTFCLYELNHGVKFSELIEINSLELPKISLQTDLTEDERDWLIFLRAENKEEFEMAAKRNSAVNEAYSELQRISDTQENRALYEARLKERRDQNSRERLAFDKGIDVGEEKGLKKGRVEGREEGAYLNKLETAKNLISLNSDSQFIAKATKLTVEEVEQIRKTIGE